MKILRRAYKDAAEHGFDYRQPRFPDLAPDDPDTDKAGRWVEPSEVYRVAWRLYGMAHENYRTMGVRKKAIIRCANLVLFALETGLRREECERLERGWIATKGAELPRRGTKTKHARVVPLTELARLIAEYDDCEVIFEKIDHKKTLTNACRDVGAEPFHLRDFPVWTWLLSKPGLAGATLKPRAGTCTLPKSAWRSLAAPRGQTRT